MGEWDINSKEDCERADCSDPPINIPVEEVIVHENYSAYLPAQHNDIALLRLSQSVAYTGNLSTSLTARNLINDEEIFATDFIKPICLPSADHSNINYEGMNLTVAGWGQTENGKYSQR